MIHPLRDAGNTVVVIKTADWVIDMGPEGGAGGGTVVAQGTPEAVAAVEASYTGGIWGRCFESAVALLDMFCERTHSFQCKIGFIGGNLNPSP